ncbi:MAG: DNA lyase [Gallionella sp.]
MLAQQALLGSTVGYRYHPQLIRFLMQDESVQAIAIFLAFLAAEANLRGYLLIAARSSSKFNAQIEETSGQLQYEWLHLKRKLEFRSPEQYNRYRNVAMAEPNPLFSIVPDDVRDREKI